MTDRNELSLSMEDHERAFTEVSFLLEILVGAIGDVVNKSSSSLAIQAGRQMGKKLPDYLAEPTLDGVLATLARRLAAGFAIEYAADASGAAVGLRRCAIRDVCAKRNLLLGGDMCRMFHFYLAGMAQELLGGRPVRAGDPIVGESCSFRLECR